MKKFSLFIHIAAVVALFCVPTSCSQDTTESVEIAGYQSQLTVGLPSTRTYLGDKEGDSYPTYWSDNDAIVVNGAVSTTTTINDNKTSATFYFANVVLETPYYITYPYTEGSACAEGKPTVVFKSEQSYVANTFDAGNAPMCGYFDGSDQIVLQHLAGVMRLSITGNYTISTIEVTAPEGVALAGEFDVDCQSGAISAIEGKTTNKVTYTANEALSADEAKDFFITVPAGNLGACEVVITEKNGLSMKLQWNATDVKAGVVREFKAFQFKGGASFELGTLPAEDDELVIEPPTENKNRVIYYTNGSTTEPTVPTDINVFGANIVSNTYNTEKECWVIKFDGDVTQIGEYAFFDCTSLTSITIPDSVTEIGEYAFSGCTSLTSVTIGNSVTGICNWAFLDCTSLTSVTIPDSVTSIGESAFYHCTSLTSVTFPDSVTSIGKAAFFHCTSLKAFYGKFASSDNRCLIVNGVLNSFAIGCGATEYTIPDSVTKIGKAAFLDCTSLTSITIPDSVTEIGDYAFSSTSLASATIGNSVTSIGGSAFSGCTSLTGITIPNSVTKIGIEAFCYSSLTSIIIPDSVTEIGEAAFIGCTSMTAFYGKFASTDNRCLIVDGVLNSFAPAGLTEYTIPDSVTKIEKYAFCECSALTSVTIPDSVTSIGSYAFSYCTSLTSITIPDSVTSIGDMAFHDCKSLTSVTIPDSVTKIGESAFYNCTSLKEVYCKPTTPPTGGSDMFSYSDNESKPIGCKIYVPISSLEAYRTAEYWSAYADSIFGYLTTTLPETGEDPDGME